MKEFTYTITDPVGIHARPAGQLVKVAKGFESAATMIAGEKSADMKKPNGLMGLGVKLDDTVTIQVEGPDEDAACAALEEFMKANF